MVPTLAAWLIVAAQGPPPVADAERFATLAINWHPESYGNLRLLVYDRTNDSLNQAGVALALSEALGPDAPELDAPKLDANRRGVVHTWSVPFPFGPSSARAPLVRV